MDFMQLALTRQSCRSYEDKPVGEEQLLSVLEAGRLAPSACNGQPYRITVCRGAAAETAAAACSGMGMNKFAKQAPVLLVISEEPYVKTAAMGAKVKGNDYRSMDIGILASHLTLQAAQMGLGTCILGWFDDRKLRELCGLDRPVRLVITLGYPKDTLREKKRKTMETLVRFLPEETP